MLNLQPGDHIRVYRFLYWHHAIYEGDGNVIHFTDARGGKADATIRREGYDRFCRGGRVEVVRYASCDHVGKTLERARNSLGKSGFSLFGNNCEHFSTWCKTGKHESAQVKAAGTALLTAGLIKLAADALSLDDEQDAMCRAMTQTGEPCRNRAYPGNYGFCRVHR